jgi:SAM-dependent methyltransferase
VVDLILVNNPEPWHGEHSFYVDPQAVARYVTYRDGGASRNELLEEEPFLRLVGEVEGATCLDIGAGYGHYTELLSARGATVTAFDQSPLMIDYAKRRSAGSKSDYFVADMRSVEFPPGTFDLAISNLAFHYVEDLDMLFARIFQWLRPGGRLVFSVEHPLLTASREPELWCERAGRRHWVVTDYFSETSRWGIFGEKYHHTSSTWINTPLRAGFILNEIDEPAPAQTTLESNPNFAEDLDRPLFLLVSLTKPKGPEDAS